jgi:hypothetical protein
MMALRLGCAIPPRIVRFRVLRGNADGKRAAAATS